MEKKITKFDLNAAFKALDEIEIPVSEGLKANVAMLDESIKPVMKTDCLLEDYYDVNNGADLEQAAVERAEEVKAAKLDKIEKIIDLDAKTPEELQPSYVGKTIIQCPQCMTLFYKDPADIVVSEDDSTIVNVAEVCQHCGNTTGYTVIGKVGAPDMPTEEVKAEEVPVEEPVAEEPVEEQPVEETPVGEETSVEEVAAEDTDLTPVETDAQEATEETEETKEEAFKAPTGSSLTEQVANALAEDVKEEESVEVTTAETVGDLVDELKDLDQEASLEFAPVEEAGEVVSIELDPTVEDGTVVAEVKTEDKTEESEEVVEESINKAEANKEVEKHHESDNASENLTLNEEGNAAWNALSDEPKGNYGKVKKELGKDGKLVWVPTDKYIIYGDDASCNPVTDIKYTKKDTDSINDIKAIGKKLLADNKKVYDVYFSRIYKNRETGQELEVELDSYTISRGIDVDEAVEICPECGKSPCECKKDECLHEDVDLDKKLKEHNEYIEYLQKMIAQEEEALGKSTNEEVKAAIQRRIDGFKADLEAALPEAVKTSVTEEDLPEPKEVGVDSENKEEVPAEEVKTESVNKSEENAPVEKKHTSENDSENLTLNEKAAVEESLVNKEAEEYVDHLTTENRTINEDAETAIKLDEFEASLEECTTPVTEATDKVSDAEFKAMINDPVFNSVDENLEVKEELPVSSSQVDAIVDKIENAGYEADINTINDLQEESLNVAVTNYLTEVYDNVNNFTATDCTINENTLIVEGIINFKSGNTKNTTFTFNKSSLDLGRLVLEGYNEDITKDKAFILEGTIEDSGSTFITEKLSYKYNINNNLVEGCTEKKTNLDENIIDNIELDLNAKAVDKFGGAKYIIRAFKKNEEGNFIPEPSKTATKYGQAEKYAKALSNEKEIGYVKIYLANLNDQEFNNGETVADLTANKDLEIVKFEKGISKENNIDRVLKILKNTKKLNKAEKKVNDLDTAVDTGIETVEDTNRVKVEIGDIIIGTDSNMYLATEDNIKEDDGNWAIKPGSKVTKLGADYKDNPIYTALKTAGVLNESIKK